MRYHNYLKLYNTNNISDRLLKATKGDKFLAYNGFKDTFELHSLRAFKKNRESLTATFFDKRHLNDWLIRDLRANDHRRFLDEIMDERQYLEYVHDKNDEEKAASFTEESMNTVRHFLGRSF